MEGSNRGLSSSYRDWGKSQKFLAGIQADIGTTDLPNTNQ
jgi:hypothetical protein